MSCIYTPDVKGGTLLSGRMSRGMQPGCVGRAKMADAPGNTPMMWTKITFDC
jgi:hypothetical protein